MWISIPSRLRTAILPSNRHIGPRASNVLVVVSLWPRSDFWIFWTMRSRSRIEYRWLSVRSKSQTSSHVSYTWINVSPCHTRTYKVCDDKCHSKLFWRLSLVVFIYYYDYSKNSFEIIPCLRSRLKRSSLPAHVSWPRYLDARLTPW